MKSSKVPSHVANMAEWETREELMQQELDNAKMRLAQMEKTMRWWSDCTANWREKYGKVRGERNKAREEGRHLRSKLEVAVKEATTWKRQHHEMKKDYDTLKEKADKLSNGMLSPTLSNNDYLVPSPTNGTASVSPAEQMLNTQPFVGGASSTISSSCGGDSMRSSTDNLVSGGEDQSHVQNTQPPSASLPQPETPEKGSDFVDQLMSKKSERPVGDGAEADDDAKKEIKNLQQKLKEALSQLKKETSEKNALNESLEILSKDLTVLKSTHEDLRSSQQEAITQVTKLKEYHKDELSRMEQDLEDETSTRVNMDKQINDLRKELERLHTENETEWSKREQMESDKFGLERDNKKLKKEIESLEEEIERKNKQASVILDGDLKTLQQDLNEKTKDLNELRHAHGKIKKLLQEKTAELEYAQRRIEQYEAEVRKIRSRVDDLKTQLASAQDQVDEETNKGHKLQRTNEELEQQIECLQVQVTHLGSRLRSTSNSHLASIVNTYDSTEFTSEDDD